MRTMQKLMLGLAMLAASLGVDAAITEGRTTNGRSYVSGGIGLEESDTLKVLADKFSLQLIVSSRSGAYLADTQVTIINSASEKLLDIQLDAPWLLVDLAPGTYKIFVAHGGVTHERNVTLAAGKREQITVPFNVPADTAKNPPPNIKY